MNDKENLHLPAILRLIQHETELLGFQMGSDLLTGSLLKTLAATKPAGHFLELGTGTGIATAWILDGMDKDSKLITVDNDDSVTSVARRYLSHDQRVSFCLEDGGAFLDRYTNQLFDLIFADTWPGKYTHLEHAINLLKTGGLYIIDDMLPQLNWPQGHADKVEQLISVLENRSDLMITKMNWSTGVIVAARIANSVDHD
jgi:predicted O-methyltransferase YrrM